MAFVVIGPWSVGGLLIRVSEVNKSKSIPTLLHYIADFDILISFGVS